MCDVLRMAAAGRVGGVRAGLGSAPVRRRRVVVVEAADWLLMRRVACRRRRCFPLFLLSLSPVGEFNL